MTSLKVVLLDAKKAVAAATTIEGTAVTLGLLNHGQDAVITAILGAVTTALVYIFGNVPKQKPGDAKAG